MLWDGTVGGGLISEINTGDKLHGAITNRAVTKFAVSLNRKYYLALVNSASSAILRVGKIGRDGLVEGRPNIVERSVLCVAISDECYIALGSEHDIKVYSCTSFRDSNYDLEVLDRLENLTIDHRNPPMTPVRVEMKGNLLYAEYSNRKYYVVWNWRESRVVHKFQRADIPDGQQYMRSDLLNARTLVRDVTGSHFLGMRYSEAVLSLRNQYAFKSSHLSACGNFFVTSDLIQVSGWLGAETNQVILVEIREVPSGEVLATIKETFDPVEGEPTSLSLSPSGNYLVILFGSTHTIRTWKIQYP